MTDGPASSSPAPAPSSLGHVPGARWAFDQDVATVFDDMLRRSIPQHDVMREAVFAVATRYVAPGTDVVDLGCARGEALAPFLERYGARCRYVGVDVSEPMLAAARERFAYWLAPGAGATTVLRIERCDLRTDYPAVRAASATLAVLTLQFVPIEHRRRVVADAYRTTVDGGCLVLVEKLIGSSEHADRLLRELYWDHKRAAGYSEEEVERKRLALEGVLVSQTAEANEAMLRREGFRHVEMFWRWMNFAGWVAVK
jgi:tRNA (cmo5U34)-methyltransferase